MKPRKYQKAQRAAFIAAVERGVSPLVVSATGTGKTYTTALILKRLMKRFSILFFATKEEHIQEPYNALKALVGDEDLGLCCAGLKRYDLDTRVLFATIGTFANRVEQARKYDFIFIDEADEVPLDHTSRYKRVIDYFDAPCGGVTATPGTAKGMIFKDGSANDNQKLFDELVCSYGLTSAISDGWLLRPVPAPRTGIESAKLRTHSGEYTVKSQEAQALDEIEAARIMREIESRPYFNKLVFACSVAHAELLSRFCTVKHLVITGTSSKADRARALRWGRKRPKEQRIIINCGVFTRGTNMPALDYGAIVRSVRSRRLFEQMLGRLLRLWGDETTVVLDDYGDNFARFGPINDWASVGRVGDGSLVRYGPCPQCEELVSVYAFNCDHCGHELKPKPHITCIGCKEKLPTAAKKCTACGMVISNETGYQFAGDMLIDDALDIYRIRRIRKDKRLIFYITAGRTHPYQRFKKILQWRESLMSQDAVSFLNAVYGTTFDRATSPYEVIRETQNEQKATKVIGDGKDVKYIW